MEVLCGDNAAEFDAVGDGGREAHSVARKRNVAAARAAIRKRPAKAVAMSTYKPAPVTLDTSRYSKKQPVRILLADQKSLSHLCPLTAHSKPYPHAKPYHKFLLKVSDIVQ